MHYISDELHAQLELLSRYSRRHGDLFTTRTRDDLESIAMQAAGTFDEERHSMPHICDECGLDLTAELHEPGCSLQPEPPEHDGEPDAGMVERSRGVLPR